MQDGGELRDMKDSIGEELDREAAPYWYNWVYPHSYQQGGLLHSDTLDCDKIFIFHDTMPDELFERIRQHENCLDGFKSTSSNRRMKVVVLRYPRHCKWRVEKGWAPRNIHDDAKVRDF